MPKVKHDRELEEFLRGEIHCQNFINQDLTFLQLSIIHAPRPKENKISSEENTTETLPIELSASIPIQEQKIDLQQPLAVDIIYDRNHSTNPVAPVQPVEPVIDLTPKEQWKKEADPNLTLTELLVLTSCREHINTSLQTLDGLYVNQLSRFLTLAQEAKKLAKKLKEEEEEASQWSGIPPEKLLNPIFTEQLNHIQALQQIVSLHCAREHLPQDIIEILEHLGKVESTPFNKLSCLAQNCADCYYTKVVQTFIELIKRSTADRQIVLVNCAQALKYLEVYRPRQAQLFTILEKYHQVPDGLEDLKSQFHLFKEVTSKNNGKFATSHKPSANLCCSLVWSCKCNIVTRLVKLETQIQNIIDKIKMDQDEVQIDALDFDPDIGRPEIQREHCNTAVVSVHELLTSPGPGSLDASNPEEETTDRDRLETRDSIPEDTHQSHHPPASKFQTIQCQILSQQQIKAKQKNTTRVKKYHNYRKKTGKAVSLKMQMQT